MEAPYRMRDLVEATGVPRTTIHFYLREGLLPAGEKTARNAALYSERHRQRIQVINRLRSGPSPAPLALVRRTLDLIDKGVPAGVAITLERSVYGDQVAADPEITLTAGQLAERVGLDPGLVDDLISLGILMIAPDSDLADGLDLEIARRLAHLMRGSDLDPRGLASIAERIREIVALEMDARDRMVTGGTPAEAARVSGMGQEFVNAWHAYLFFRARLHEIARRGLGVEEGGTDRGDLEA